MSDTALLWLLGEDEIKFNMKELKSSFTRQDIQTVFSDNDWQCGARKPRSATTCVRQIGTFNGFPSRVLTLYFRDDNISAMAVLPRPIPSKQLMGHFIQQLGQPGNVEAVLNAGPDADNILNGISNRAWW